MKTTPMLHQIDGANKSRFKKQFGFFYEQGCGKTWSQMEDAEFHYLEGEIKALLVIAPKGVHTNWIRREIPTHMSVPLATYLWKGQIKTAKAKKVWDKFLNGVFEQDKLRIFAINVDAFNTKHGRETVDQFIKHFKDAVMAAVDESTRIKNPNAKRAQHVVKICEYAKYKRIMSGTPVTKAPTDLYMQFHFLKPGLLGTKSYRAFVAQYAHLVPEESRFIQDMMERHSLRVAPQIVAVDDYGQPRWKNLDKLVALVKPHIHRVRKKDCLDLPDKVYERIYYELTPSLRKVYDRLESDGEFVSVADMESHSFEAIAARAKMKQVVSGFISIAGEWRIIAEDVQPRIDALNEILDQIDDGAMGKSPQIIIWSIFKEEINIIKAALETRKLTYMVYTGATSDKDRELAVDGFQAGEFDVFVANPQAAGIGLTLTAAEYVIYFSCSYDLELRLQSEDRAHRIGQKKVVKYFDIIAEETLDEDIMDSLLKKKTMAETLIDNPALLSQSNQA